MKKDEIKSENQLKEEKVKKSKKEEKTVPVKKLPKIFRKSYLPQKFEKKIINKLYIDADKNLLKSIFKEDTNKKGQKIVKVSCDSKILKKDLARFKQIAKDLKNQKAGIKFVPLLASVSLCAAIVIGVLLFKNLVVKKVLVSSMQGIFNAKCDIEDVDFQIFGASLVIQDIQQANKDKPMTNLFQIGKVAMDYNLTELLRGKFVVEEISVTDVALDTERKTSGELLKKTESKEVKAEKEQTSNKMNELMDSAANELKAMFENYNPEKLLENFQSELKSPETAKQIAEDVKIKVEKWSKKPEEMKKQITDFSASVDSLSKKINSASDSQRLALIKEGLALLEDGNSLLKSFDTVAKDIKTDSEDVKSYSTKLSLAVKEDTNFVNSKVNELKATFSPSGLQNIMNGAVESLLYKYCGEFYPYISKIMDYALSAAKNSSSQAKETDSSSKTESKKVAKKSDGIKRADGRYVYFKNDTVPKFLVQKLEASGKEYQGEGELFHGYATDISSNMDQWGKPAVVEADFKIGSNANKANLTLDARSSSNAPLLLANYSGNGYPINFNAQVFDLTSNANISAKMTADSDGTWSLGGNLDMKVSKMAGMDFEPAQINAIYKNALSKVSSLSVNFTVGYNSSGMFVKIENPEKIASQLVTPLVKALEDELSVIAKNASQKLTVLISEKTGIASEQINSFNLLEKDISSYQNQLKSKQAEFTSLLNKKEISSSATSSIIEKATGSSDAASKISNALNKFKR